MKTTNIKFNKMYTEDPFERPEFLKTGYTFRNEGGSGNLVFTLLDDYNPEKNIHGNIHVLCHNIVSNYTFEETWNDCEYLEGSFKNGEYFPYWEDCEWLKNYYNE